MERSVVTPPITPVTAAPNFGGATVTRLPANEALRSGVSWAAVVAGGFVTAALSLILLSLGTGLGLASISPWANAGASAAAIGVGAIVGLILLQLIPSAIGGYIAGRLRTKWVAIHSDEVFFRDTAHGFLSWAVAVVLTAAFLTTAAAGLVGSAIHAGDSTGTNGVAERPLDPNAYFVDMLLRTDRPNAGVNDETLRQESGRILAHALAQSEMPAADKTYLSQIVTAQTGLSPADADQRVNAVMSEARQAIDSARKTARNLSLWIFIALLIGAFSASFAATIGGDQRDHVITI